jgi:hypothetical protein
MDWGGAIKGIAKAGASYLTGGLSNIALGALSAGGQLLTNKQNQKMADKQMQFQDQESSTAVQRSVKDYEAAGLNPALAYDRSASSPGGASAMMGDVVGSGISTAQQSKQLQMALQQNAADLQVKRSQENLNTAAAHKAAADAGVSLQTNRNLVDQGKLLQQQFDFNSVNQPFDQRTKAAIAALQEFQLAGAKNESDWQQMIGKTSAGLSTAKTAAEILKMLPIWKP